MVEIHIVLLKKHAYSSHTDPHQGINMKETTVLTQPSKVRLYSLKRSEILLFAVVILVICIGWFVSFHYKKTLRQAIIDSYQETQLEIVRSVARAIELYVKDELGKGTDITTIEQRILKRFVAPIHLLENGDAWIYAPNYVVYDVSSDFPDIYRNKKHGRNFFIAKAVRRKSLRRNDG